MSAGGATPTFNQTIDAPLMRKRVIVLATTVQEYNGKMGWVWQYDVVKQRYRVSLDGPEQKLIKVRALNLAEVHSTRPVWAPKS